MNFIDTHAHLDFADDIDGWLERAGDNDVNKIICVGTSIEASKKCIEIAEKFSSGDLQIYATCGIHAQDGNGDVEKYGSLYQCINTLKQIALTSKKVVGVGECGLDYYVTSDKLPSDAKALAGRQLTTDKEREFQKELFEGQIKLAADLELPLIIHCRNAWEETFEILGNYSSSLSTNARDKLSREVSAENSNLKGKFSTSLSTSSSLSDLGVEDMSSRPNGANKKLHGVFHSWTRDWEAAGKALELGFYISFSGIVTFKNAPKVQEVARKMPLDRILLETDSPFLSPEPLRGKQNEPKNVKIVAEFIAKLRNLPVDQIAGVTSQNVGKLFGIWD